MFPGMGTVLKFNNQGRVCVSACLKSFLIPQDSRGCVETVHVPSAYSYVVLARQGDVTERFSYTGEDAVSNYVCCIQQRW